MDVRLTVVLRVMTSLNRVLCQPVYVSVCFSPSFQLIELLYCLVSSPERKLRHWKRNTDTLMAALEFSEIQAPEGNRICSELSEGSS